MAPKNPKKDIFDPVDPVDDTPPADDADFPDDGAEAEDEGAQDEGEDFNQDDPEPEPDESPAPPPPPRRKRGFLSGAPRRPAPARAPRKPRGASKKTVVTTVTTDSSTDDAATPSSSGAPSILRLLQGGSGTNQLVVKRVRTKGHRVPSSDTGYTGRFTDTPNLPDVIAARFGGGSYELAGTVDGKTVTEELELPGDSLPLVGIEQNPMGPMGGIPGMGTFPLDDRIFDDDRDYGPFPTGPEQQHRDTAWWVWDQRKGEWSWKKPGVPTPTCPPPNQGLPPAQVTQSGSDWWNAAKTTTDDGALEREREARRKAEEDARLLSIQNKHDKEMQAVLQRLDALAAAAQRPHEDPMKGMTQFLQTQMQKDAEDRKERLAEERARLDRERAERLAEENRRREEAKAEADRRERDRKDEMDREEKRREERERREREFMQMMFTQAKGQSMASTMKDMFAMAAGFKDLLGVGAQSEGSEKLEMLRVGGEIVTNSLIPALADMVAAYKFGRPATPTHVDGEPIMPTTGTVAVNHGPTPRPQLPGPANGGQPAVANELSDQQTAQLLDWAIKAYQSGNTPAVAAVAFVGYTQGAGIPTDKARVKIGETTAEQLVAMFKTYAPMIPNGHPMKQLITSALATLDTPDGKAWYQSFADRVSGKPPKPTPPPAAPEPPAPPANGG